MEKIEKDHTLAQSETNYYNKSAIIVKGKCRDLKNGNVLTPNVIHMVGGQH